MKTHKIIETNDGADFEFDTNEDTAWAASWLVTPHGRTSPTYKLGVCILNAEDIKRTRLGIVKTCANALVVTGFKLELHENVHQMPYRTDYTVPVLTLITSEMVKKWIYTNILGIKLPATAEQFSKKLFNYLNNAMMEKSIDPPFANIDTESKYIFTYRLLENLIELNKANPQIKTVLENYKNTINKKADSLLNMDTMSP